MFCPNCEIEYLDGFEVCADCGANLVPGPPREETLLPKPEYDYVSWQVVKGFCEDVEAAMIAGVLESAGIPVFKRPYGDGAFLRYYIGVSQGVQILVPEADAKKATELLAEYNYIEYAEQFGHTPEEALEESGGKKRRIIAWFLAFPSLVTILAALLSVILALYFIFFRA